MCLSETAIAVLRTQDYLCIALIVLAGVVSIEVYPSLWCSISRVDLVLFRVRTSQGRMVFEHGVEQALGSSPFESYPLFR